MSEENLKEFESLDRVQNFIKEVVKPIFPKARTSQTSVTSKYNKSAQFFEGKLSTITLFNDTDYEYKGNGRFIHFTSLFGLKYILDSGFLRMSEFGNLIDKNELLYGASIFKSNSIFQYKEENFDEFKKSLFCLSMCKANEKTKRNSYMWEVYGDKGRGAIIEFKFTNNKPKAFLLGNIQYGVGGLNPLQKLKELTENYIKRTEIILPKDFIELTLELQSFHKSKRYEEEQEVRLLFNKYTPFISQNHKSIYQDINSKNEIKYFNKLFLKGRHPFLDSKPPFSDEKDAVFNLYPQIEIKNIILGYGLSTKNKCDFFDILNKIKAMHSYKFGIFHIENEKNILKIG